LSSAQTTTCNFAPLCSVPCRPSVLVNGRFRHIHGATFCMMTLARCCWPTVLPPHTVNDLNTTGSTTTCLSLGRACFSKLTQRNTAFTTTYSPHATHPLFINDPQRSEVFLLRLYRYRTISGQPRMHHSRQTKPTATPGCDQSVLNVCKQGRGHTTRKTFSSLRRVCPRRRGQVPVAPRLFDSTSARCPLRLGLCATRTTRSFNTCLNTSVGFGLT